MFVMESMASVIRTRTYMYYICIFSVISEVVTITTIHGVGTIRGLKI